MHKCLSANLNRKLFYTHTQYTHTYIPEWKRRVRGNAKGAQASSIRRARFAWRHNMLSDICVMSALLGGVCVCIRNETVETSQSFTSYSIPRYITHRRCEADGAIDICCGKVNVLEGPVSYKINEIIKTTIWADKEYVKWGPVRKSIDLYENTRTSHKPSWC